MGCRLAIRFNGGYVEARPNDETDDLRPPAIGNVFPISSVEGYGSILHADRNISNMPRHTFMSSYYREVVARGNAEGADWAVVENGLGERIGNYGTNGLASVVTLLHNL